MYSTTPDVSVVIATFNMGQYLADAIKSVLNQTYGSVEVHVVDDGSTDNTREVIAPFLKDRRVHYYYQKNAGQTKAKNVGVRAAKGRYIGFCDADDLWAPNKLMLQVPVMDGDPRIAVTYTRTREIDQDGNPMVEPEYPQYSGNVTQQLFIQNFVPFGTALVRRSAMEAVNGFDEELRMGIDWDLWLRLSVKYPFQGIPQIAYLYRVWPGQMSKNWKGRYESAFRIMDRFEKNFPGVIEPKIRQYAVSVSYLHRAHARSSMAGDRLGALADCYRSVRAGGSLKEAVILGAKILLRRAPSQPQVPALLKS